MLETSKSCHLRCTCLRSGSRRRWLLYGMTLICGPRAQAPPLQKLAQETPHCCRNMLKLWPAGSITGNGLPNHSLWHPESKRGGGALSARLLPAATSTSIRLGRYSTAQHSGERQKEGMDSCPETDTAPESCATSPHSGPRLFEVLWLADCPTTTSSSSSSSSLDTEKASLALPPRSGPNPL